MTPRPFTLLDAATAVTAVAIAALALWIGTHGPLGPLPMQFDLQGRPDRWGDRAELAMVLGFMAAMAAISAGSMGWFAARIEDASRRRGLRAGQLVALVAIAGATAFMTISILRETAGDGGASGGWAMAGLGLLLAVIGAGLGRVAPNPLIGVRTPWAYKSRLAWDRSNRLGGRLLFWLGLAALAAAPLAPQPLGMTALIVAVMVAAVTAVVESWRVWRADPDRQPF